MFYALQSLLFFKALEYIPASTATLILYFYPVSVTLLSVFIFKLPASSAILLSLALILSGCALVFYDAFVKDLNITGIMLALGAMLGLSFYLITVQFFLRGEQPLSVTFYAILFTSLFYMFLSNPLKIFKMNGAQFAITAGLALIPTVIAVSMLYRAIEQIGSAYTSIFSTLEPVVTVGLAYLLLDENVVLIQVLGMMFIIIGFIVPNVKYLLLERRSKAIDSVE